MAGAIAGAWTILTLTIWMVIELAEKTSYIKLDRNITRWRWWHDHNTLVVFLWLLLEANIRDNGFSGITVHRGQIATSFQTLCNSTGLSVHQVRTAISHLKMTGEVAVTKYPRYQVITIINYDKYQDVAVNVSRKCHADDTQVSRKWQQSKNIRSKEGKKERMGSLRSPDSPSGVPDRGTDAFRARSHLLLGVDEGTADDIPEDLRDMFGTWEAYWRWRHQ